MDVNELIKKIDSSVAQIDEQLELLSDKLDDFDLYDTEDVKEYNRFATTNSEYIDRLVSTKQRLLEDKKKLLEAGNIEFKVPQPRVVKLIKLKRKSFLYTTLLNLSNHPRLFNIVYKLFKNKLKTWLK